MEIQVNRLVRRPEGPRTLIYLDQSTLSALVKEESHAELLQLLRGAVEADRAICPVSPSHHEETARIHRREPETWKAIDKLADELALGTQFRGLGRIELSEISAAAAGFEGQTSEALWREAFREDPHRPRDKIFFDFLGSPIRVRAFFEPDAAEQAEIDYERSKEEGMDAVYEELRTKGFSFEEMAEGNLEQMINWKLGPLLAPLEFARLYVERRAEVTSQVEAGEQPALGPGSALGRLLALESRRSHVEDLVSHHPKIRQSSEEFRKSGSLRDLPTLAFPALLRAALAAHRDRRARASDGHDIAHLTVGLSRCDIVTADGGMAQLIKGYRLAPSGCEVFSYREVEPLGVAVEACLSKNKRQLS
jgi:hypothetical protein